MNPSPLLDLATSCRFSISTNPHRQLFYRLVTTFLPADLYLINSRYASKVTFPKIVSTYTIFEHLGWSRVAPVHELGSRLLTIKILGTLQIVDYGITFHCFGRDFGIYWKGLANRLGFHERCSIDLGFSLGVYQRHAFWHLISGQHVVGKF